MFTKTRFWIILFSALFILGCGAFLLLRSNGEVGTLAKVSSDGELLFTVDLDAVVTPYDYVATSEYGENTIHIEHGAISVTQADCPDQICVHQGDIKGPGIPIVCMPNRLVIEIEGEP